MKKMKTNEKNEKNSRKIAIFHFFGKLQFSSSFFFIFLIIFLIIFDHFFSFFINSTTGSKHDKTMIKKW